MKIPFRKKAFTLIEMSIVILVIGLIIAGAIASNALVKKFRIQTAQNLTTSSPVQGISDSVFWLESSLDKSFNSSESSDTASLSAWYDVRENVNKNNATQSTSLNQPTYSNSINSIQAVKFDGTNGYFSVDGSVLNNTNYTIFVLENRESNKSGNYFIGDSSSGNEATTNKNLVLGYSADGTIKHSQSSDNSYTSSITTYSASSGSPRIFAFVHDKSVGKKTYINGLLAATSTDTNHLSGMTTLTIGKSYQGQIGEIVAFARALTTEERQSVEDYLGKKWNSRILRTVGNTALGASCVGGTISTTGCQLSCTVSSTAGITATTVSDGTGTLTCDSSSNYTGSVSYTCSNGTFSASGSCGCTTGYVLSGSSCVSTTCTFSGTNGITNGTNVNYTTTPTAQACNAGYTGTVYYTCDGGGAAPTITSGACYLSPCTTSGTVTTTNITVSGTGYTLHQFTSGTGSISNCPTSRTATILVVGGGGGGGVRVGGAGGGGGVYTTSMTLNTSTTYNLSVGAGGTYGTGGGWPAGTNGSSSYFSTYMGTGGGGGGGYGAAGSAGTTMTGGYTGTVGSAGGRGAATSPTTGTGIGGAGNENNPVTITVCPGNEGTTSSITGTAVVYGSGGGGAAFFGSSTKCFGGTNAGRGGYGTSAGGTAIGGNGIVNTGSGGGGGAVAVNEGGTGGTGVVIVRYAN